MYRSLHTLDDQHYVLSLDLEAAASAARAGHWSEYRRAFAEVREALLEHMAHEEAALFPSLEKRDRAAARQLKEEHDGVRAQLKVLSSIEPERDPGACLAELEALALLLSWHLAAEMAFDPDYASRPALA